MKRGMFSIAEWSTTSKLWVKGELAKTCKNYFMETDLPLMVFFTKNDGIGISIYSLKYFPNFQEKQIFLTQAMVQNSNNLYFL